MAAPREADPAAAWWEPEEEARAMALEGHAYAREMLCMGIADGWRRLPLDPAHADEPEYREGHAQGMDMPAHTAPRD